jgi:uracil-DNA glycosylase family 4
VGTRLSAEVDSQILRLHPPGQAHTLAGVIRPVDVLLEFLEAEHARGVTHVHLDEGARDGLRSLFNRVKHGVPAPAAPVATIPEPMATPVITEVKPTGATRREQLDSLRIQADKSQPIKALGTLREAMVFSTGNPEAKVMFIGEAPGYLEEKERQPFVGPAGQKLSDILKAMGTAREEVYLTTLVKFRPAMAGQTTNNRKPSAAEIAACLPFLRAEIRIVQPLCIVALGEGVAEGLLGLTGPIPFSRGAWHDFEGIPARVTYHPSTLLQTQGVSTTKRQLWEDMLAVMEKISLPISEKQRGFFLPKPA